MSSPEINCQAILEMAGKDGREFVTKNQASGMNSIGLLLRQFDDRAGKVYRIEVENGQVVKRWIKTAAIFNVRGYNWNDIIDVTKQTINFFPTGSVIASASEIGIILPASEMQVSTSSLSQMQFTVESQVAADLTVTVFNLSGYKVFDSGEVRGNTLVWKLQDDANRPFANGIYLYVTTYRKEDGTILKSEIKKLIVRR